MTQTKIQFSEARLSADRRMAEHTAGAGQQMVCQYCWGWSQKIFSLHNFNIAAQSSVLVARAHWPPPTLVGTILGQETPFVNPDYEEWA